MKRFDDYLIVTDLDGTLYKNQNNIPEVNLRAIDRFVENGGNFTVATGRGIEAARFITEKINIPSPVIVNNGHAIYDYNNEKILFSEYLPDAIKDFTIDLMNHFPNAGVEVYSDRELYVIRANETVTTHLDYEGVKYDIVDFETARAKKWSKLLIADELDGIKEIREFAAAQPKCGFEMLNTSRHFMEGVTSGVNKGTAVKQLARLLNIPDDKIFTIGNYYNDKELVESAYIGALVSDSPEDLISSADYVTEKTCENGGFGEFVEYVMTL